MNMAHWLWATARRMPAAPALFRGASLQTDYAGFASGAAAVATSLAALGIGRDDRVMIAMGNRTEYLVALFGIWWAGAVAVPVNAKLHGRELAWIVAHAGASLVFADDERGTLLRAEQVSSPIADPVEFNAQVGAGGPPPVALPAELASDELAWLFYTSGTTGRPKAAMLTHANLQAMALCYQTDVDIVRPEDAVLYAAPMSHGAGLYSLIHVRRGCRHVVPPSGNFDADEVLALAAKFDSASLFAVPTMVRRLTDAAARTGDGAPGLRTIVYGGGPMYGVDIDRALEVFGNRLVQIYGQGETPMTITALDRASHMPASGRGSQRYTVGRAQSTIDVRVVDEAGVPLSSGTAGEIEVRGPTVMAGYWKDPEATAAAVVAGWLRTGDRGWFDADGYLTLADRSRDVIISGGSNIYPREVEEALLFCLEVADVAVVGFPDEEWGEAVCAFVVGRDGVAPDRAVLDAYCAERIARYKRPKRYEFVEALPRNDYGKVLRTELRRKLDV